MKRLILAAVAALALLCTPAWAQNTSAGLTPCGNGSSLSVTSVTSNTQLSACGAVAVVWNLGTTEVFLNWGTASNTAAVAATGWSLPGGGSITLSTGRAALYLAAITASGSSTLRIVQGTGAPAISGPAAGSGGVASSVNLAQVGGASISLGQALMAASLPVTLASNQSALTVTGAGGTFPVTMASGAVASGAYSSGAFAAGSHASGSIASGAYASGAIGSGAIATGAYASGAIGSGAVASGAYASGSLASGAVVDLVASQTPVAAGAATATKGLLLGGQFDTTQKTLTNGQQAAISASARGALFVATGADTFTVTGSGGTFPVTAASGAFASGSHASGAFASGSIASGAVASGAYSSGSIASGAIAAGAMVDLLTMRGTVAAGTAAANSMLIGGVYNSTVPVLTNAQQVARQVDTAGSMQVNTEGKKTTYNASTSGTMAASATDQCTLLGSGTKTIRLVRVQVSGVATANGTVKVSLRTYSTAYTGGTSGAMGAAANDSTNAAPTATTLQWFSGLPTVGALASIPRTEYMTFDTAATSSVSVRPTVWTFGDRNTQAIVLRGTGQYAAVNFLGATPSGGAITCDFEWTEE